MQLLYLKKKKKHRADSKGTESEQDPDVFFVVVVTKWVMFASVFTNNECVRGVLFACFVFLFLFSVWFTLFIDGNGTKGPFVGLNENPHPCGFNQASSCMRIGSSSSPLHPCAKKSEKGSFLCCCLNDSQ